MTRSLASRWARLPLATGMALLLALAVPAAAWPATGSVGVTVRAPSEQEDTSVSLPNPTDGHCYTVRELAPNFPEGSYFTTVYNHTDKTLSAYNNDTCTGPQAYPPVPPGQRGIHSSHSFKLG